jgi:hypothetical protein
MPIRVDRELHRRAKEFAKNHVPKCTVQAVMEAALKAYLVKADSRSPEGEHSRPPARPAAQRAQRAKPACPACA